MQLAAVAASVARAQASAQSAKKVRQMMEEQQQKIAAMSPDARQRLRESMMQKATKAMARMQPVNSSKPVRDRATKAPMRGSTRHTHAAKSTQGSSPTQRQHTQPVATEVLRQHAHLMSTDELREATSTLLRQHGWSRPPTDAQAIVLFREQVEQLIRSKQRSRNSRQRRRQKRTYYRQQRNQDATQQQSDY